MSPTSKRLLLVLTIAVLVTGGAIAGSTVLARESNASIQQIPCDPKATRTISPLIVEEGGELTVHVEYTTECTGESPVINFFLLVENTSALRGPRNQVLNNAKRALQNFVNQVDYSNGSMGGLTLYASTYTNRVTLRGGDDGRDALLQAINLISVQPIGEVAGTTGAIRDCSERLPTGEEGTNNALFILDSGAQLDPNGPTLSDIQSACKAAGTSGIKTYVVGRPTSGNRLCGVDCCTGGFKFSGTEDGSDLPDVFDEFAREIFQGKMAINTEYYDSINSMLFEYVKGSAAPVEPDNLYGSEYSWQFPPPGLTPRVIEYKVKVVEGVFNQIAPMSYRSELVLTYQDQTTMSMPLENPEICVYKKGDPSFCSGAAKTQTAQVPTPTSGAETATPVTPTVTSTEPPTNTPATQEPTATLTPTDEPTGYKVYLPSLLNERE